MKRQRTHSFVAPNMENNPFEDSVELLVRTMAANNRQVATDQPQLPPSNFTDPCTSSSGPINVQPHFSGTRNSTLPVDLAHRVASAPLATAADGGIYEMARKKRRCHR
ncbi:uncharacterized protein LOC144101403 [Amblyomma americanum]